ncbi:hypothetical protein SAMN05428642_10343 [Flaviramulus basaltis]|uniref:PrcB C-terminal n=1 Tax=Flaviramulus basaltis TaxID=369401 RepID=A0A1K2IM47_9FLAO|nr:protease complex subunit PrcB family protein [Flaviramulus basaltis]SFZ93280.1 hypothetical protein SAMN05428642_10343 [Flaviramulus basaltis]
MKAQFLTLLFLASGIVISCNNDDNSNTINIESTLIAKDNLFGNGSEGLSKQNMVITDQSIWDELITKMNTTNNESSNFSEVDIDFSEYLIIAIFDEIKTNGGHSLELNIFSNTENIIVKITDLAPQGNATTVMTQPYHIVKIPKTNLPIVFE